MARRGLTMLSMKEFTITAPQPLNAVRRGGLKNPGAKLTADDIRKLRELRAGGARIAELAKRFGVANSTVCNIARGLRYREVQ